MLSRFLQRLASVLCLVIPNMSWHACLLSVSVSALLRCAKESAFGSTIVSMRSLHLSAKARSRSRCVTPSPSGSTLSPLSLQVPLSFVGRCAMDSVGFLYWISVCDTASRSASVKLPTRPAASTSVSSCAVSMCLVTVLCFPSASMALSSRGPISRSPSCIMCVNSLAS